MKVNNSIFQKLPDINAGLSAVPDYPLYHARKHQDNFQGLSSRHTGKVGDLCDSMLLHILLYPLDYLEQGGGISKLGCAYLDGAGTGHNKLQGVFGRADSPATNNRYLNLIRYPINHV